METKKLKNEEFNALIAKWQSEGKIDFHILSALCLRPFEMNPVRSCVY